MEVFDVFDFRDAANRRLSGNRFCDGSSEFESSGRRRFSGLLVWSSVGLVARLWGFFVIRWEMKRRKANQILQWNTFQRWIWETCPLLLLCPYFITGRTSFSHPWITFLKVFSHLLLWLHLPFFFFSFQIRTKVKWNDLFFLWWLLLLFCSWLFLSIWLSCGPGEAVCRFESHLLRYGPGLNLNFNALKWHFLTMRENVKCLQISVE